MIAIVEPDGTEVVRYVYNAWGKVLSTTGPEAADVGYFNPLLYRGYVYDVETELYYLQSRYYDPEMGRFVNADGLASTGQGVLGNNAFAYCGNNPISNKDCTGTRYCAATTVAGESSDERKEACQWQNKIVLSKQNPEPFGEYSGGDIYVITDPTTRVVLFPGDVVVEDYRNGSDHEMKIQYSALITSKSERLEILQILYDLEASNPTGWGRTIDSMMYEWDLHNAGYMLSNLLPLSETLSLRFRDVNLDKASEGWSLKDFIWNEVKKKTQ